MTKVGDMNDSSQCANKYTQVLQQTQEDSAIYHRSADATTLLVNALTVKQNTK